MHAHIIVDLGFGDAGKGLLTDFLVRHFNADLVVRYNGGAQAGHNVVTPDGRHHTFAQFGSGSFLPGVKTYLSQHVVIHPGALLVEGDLLAGKGIRDPFAWLRLSEQALVITPFHQAANRIREIARGAGRHGSCGVGVGETVADALTHPETRILAGNLADAATLKQKLRLVRAWKREELAELCRDRPLDGALAREWKIFEEDDLIDAWVAAMARIVELGLVAPDSLLAGWLGQTDHVIFEGAQGVLLDAEEGFHPYTTWSRCTAGNALDLITEMAPGAGITRVGVVRSHAVRHGPGPLPTETDTLSSIISEHNRRNDWQGAVRYGWFDAVLTRYALNVTGEVDSLLVTHLDSISGLNEWKYCSGYTGIPGLDELPVNASLADGILRNFRLLRTLPLEQRERFTQALSAARPVVETCEPHAGQVIEKIESLLGKPMGWVSAGPTAKDVRILNSIPG